MAEEMNKIASACVAECIRQDVEIFELGNLLLAYNYALQCEDESPWLAAINLLGRMVDPINNADGYRMTPVTFATGGSAVPAGQIERAMAQLGKGLEQMALNTPANIDNIVENFLKIHPFRDGNGRTAFILHNWMSRTLHDPHPLPEYTFV